jgi:hypothetical protein
MLNRLYHLVATSTAQLRVISGRVSVFYSSILVLLVSTLCHATARISNVLDNNTVKERPLRYLKCLNNVNVIMRRRGVFRQSSIKRSCSQSIAWAAQRITNNKVCVAGGFTPPSSDAAGVFTPPKVPAFLWLLQPIISDSITRI